MANELNTSNIVEGSGERHLTERARIAAEDGVAGFQTNSHSTSRTIDEHPDRNPEHNVDSATVVADQRRARHELRERLQLIDLPDHRPSQVGHASGLSI